MRGTKHVVGIARRGGSRHVTEGLVSQLLCSGNQGKPSENVK